MADEETTTTTADPAAEAAAAQEEQRTKSADSGEKRLAFYVYVSNPADGSTNVFGPEDEVPDWAQEQITNPKAWSGGQLHAIDETAVTPGANEFATTGAK